MADAQFKELAATAKTLKDNKQDAEAINALEKLIATGNYYSITYDNIIINSNGLAYYLIRWTIKRNY